MDKPTAVGLLTGAVISFFFWLLLFTSFFYVIELKAYDQLFRARGRLEVSPEIVIVAIDNESMGWIGKWPWPRTYHATLVSNLKAAGAGVIAFDVLFDNVSSIDPAHDQIFAREVKKAGNVILGSSFFEKVDPRLGRITGQQLPIPPLAAAAARVGFTNPPVDQDGFIRRYFPFHDGEDQRYSSLALQAVSLYRPAAYPIPLDKEGSVFINYAGGEGTYRTVPFNQVMDNSIVRRMPDLFKGKMVLVGATTTDLHDLFPVPFSMALPGVEIHANVADMILKGRYLKRVPPFFQALLLLGVGLVSGGVLVRLSALRGLFLAGGEIVFLFLLAFYLFAFRSTWLILVAPVLTVFLTYGAVLLYRFVTEEREKRRIRGIFSRYVSRQVVDEILKESQELALGGRRKEVTVLFSDIRNFTTMSERMKPEEVVAILNEYFAAMVEVIFRHEGTLDKYIGDAIMAVFGSPLSRPDDAERAVRAAVDMQTELKRLQAKWQLEGREPFDIGIGINTGEVVVGNIGSEKRMEYTVIGDNVNLASRLEGLNKQYQSHIIVSESVYEKLKDKVNVRPLEAVTVKGKTRPVMIYEVLGIA